MLAVKDPKYWYLNFTATSVALGGGKYISSASFVDRFIRNPAAIDNASTSDVLSLLHAGVWFVSFRREILFLSVFTCFGKFVWRQRGKGGILILEEASLFSSFQFLLGLLPLIRIALIDLRSNLIESGHVPFWSDANGIFG